MWEFLVILLLVGAMAILVGPMLMRRRGAGAGADWPSGQLLVTGVSPRPADQTGRQFVTITGVINGPTVNEHVVYERLEVDVNDWPSMGQLFPVVYSAKNPDNWRFAPSAPSAPPPAV